MLPAHIAREREFVQEHEEVVSSRYYMIDGEWFKRWAKYVKNMGPSPGPITNSRLLQAGDKPKPNMRAGKDYRGVCDQVWEFLQSRHGGGPEISSAFIDIYRPDVQVKKVADIDGCSSTSTVSSFGSGPLDGTGTSSIMSWTSFRGRKKSLTCPPAAFSTEVSTSSTDRPVRTTATGKRLLLV
mmetsp:Transcript_27829/g.64660  ORF Transcript_27829/g.64660 Transcript_27829/m.64660 type:complete len:183 (+) Transcript_27829:115-663(+)|eukprot:CAMPEP_0178451752 /NCGR_PEP_ID=MMETSP0689_2-20121128/43861_1 /TAXON_ID=160604 /ORGANISM="Amphidinium massartii, Strain CS-259" /LENGTH=182 /DNA_ID=CAMNT_0020077377 /DNA_START=100 /DNA_END=648 /DNA_ORIENTATION=-